MPFADRSVRRERMRPPRLAEAPHQRRVARLEEDQHRVQPRHLPQLPEDLRERRQEAALADVDDDRDLLDVAAGAQRQLRQRRNQRRRQVVDAEVAEILERADRLRLARSRQPGEDDERLPRAASRLPALVAPLGRFAPASGLAWPLIARLPTRSLRLLRRRGAGCGCSRSVPSSRSASSRAA